MRMLLVFLLTCNVVNAYDFYVDDYKFITYEHKDSSRMCYAITPEIDTIVDDKLNNKLYIKLKTYDYVLDYSNNDSAEWTIKPLGE